MDPETSGGCSLGHQLTVTSGENLVTRGGSRQGVDVSCL